MFDLIVASGEVSARVAGSSRPRPYRVRLTLPTFSDDQWAAAVAALAGQLRHAAALLDGRMPDDVDDVFAQAGVSLFPAVTSWPPPAHVPTPRIRVSTWPRPITCWLRRSTSIRSYYPRCVGETGTPS